MIPYIAQDYYDALVKLHTEIGDSKSGVEVGLGWGTSAQAYLNTHAKAHLDSIEQADYHRIFKKIKEQYGNRIDVIVGRTPDVYIQEPLSMYDFAFIDGAHDFDSVMWDISGILPHVNEGGIIAFDDYGVEGTTEEGFPHGVKRAVDFVFKYKPIFLERNIIAFRKE